MSSKPSSRMRLATRWWMAASALAALSCAGSPERDPGQRARQQLAAGQPELAARSIEAAVREAPRDFDLRVEAADIQLERESRERALQHLEVAQSLRPWDPEIAIRLGEIEQSRGNVAAAYVAFRRAVELAPDNLKAVAGLALAADALGLDDEALAAYERWSELEEAAAQQGAP